MTPILHVLNDARDGEQHLSTRYNIEDMDQEERNNIYIPELQMTWGSAWSALPKSWQAFYAARRTVDSEGIDMLLERITMIKKCMGG